MERTTWMTEERTAAPAPGAAMFGRGRRGWAMSQAGLIQKQPVFTPLAHGPGLVCGSTAATSHTNDHAAPGRTAADGTPLGSPGAGHG